MRLDVTMLFKLGEASAPDVYRTVGTDYRDILLIPQLRSYLRAATASYEAKALYTSGRELVATAIEKGLADQLRERGFDNVQILLREILLPTQISQAIEEKLSAEQQAEKMRFILDRETREAERKRIEASGIADFQTIVSDGISEKLLRWKGIEATEALARSSNAKVVVIGGSDGLPLILNTDKLEREKRAKGEKTVVSLFSLFSVFSPRGVPDPCLRMVPFTACRMFKHCGRR